MRRRYTFEEANKGELAVRNLSKKAQEYYYSTGGNLAVYERRDYVLLIHFCQLLLQKSVSTNSLKSTRAIDRRWRVAESKRKKPKAEIEPRKSRYS